MVSHRKVPSHRRGRGLAAPGSKRLHTSVISRCLNLNLCTRHQYKYMYHIAGCRLHHEFILLLCQVSSIRHSSRFVSGRLWVQVPHLAPPFRFTPGRHGSQRRSSLGYAEGNLSVKSVGEINSLDALFWSNPQMLKQWQSSGTLPQNYSVCTFGQVTVHLAGFKAVFTAVLTRVLKIF